MAERERESEREFGGRPAYRPYWIFWKWALKCFPPPELMSNERTFAYTRNCFATGATVFDVITQPACFWRDIRGTHTSKYRTLSTRKDIQGFSAISFAQLRIQVWLLLGHINVCGGCEVKWILFFRTILYGTKNIRIIFLCSWRTPCGGGGGGGGGGEVARGQMERFCSSVLGSHALALSLSVTDKSARYRSPPLLWSPAHPPASHNYCTI